MADVVDVTTRSRMMASIRSKNTKPEMIIRKGLHALGFRYSLHPKNIPGKPDIFLPKWHVVIFIHGCFWHKHGCHLSKIPTTNTEFWNAKLIANQNRDEIVKLQLVKAGWRTATIWECATRGKTAESRLPDLLDTLATWIRDQTESPTIEIPASDLPIQQQSADHISLNK